MLGHFGTYTFIRPYLEEYAGATPVFITVVLMVFGVAGAVGNFIAGPLAQRSLRGSFLVGSTGLVASLLLLLAIGQTQGGAIVALIAWGLSFGIVQLSQVNMTLASAPDTFEAAMSLNTMAYNTSIALGALFGGLITNGLGVRSVVWFGIALTATSLLLALSAARTTSPAARGKELAATR